MSTTRTPETVAEEMADLHRLVLSGAAKRIRLTSGVTQAEVGTSIGATGEAVSRWESGHRSPRGARGLAYRRLLRKLEAGA